MKPKLLRPSTDRIRLLARQAYARRREYFAAAAVEWRRKNRERYLDQFRKRYYANPERARKKARDWYWKNVEKCRAMCARYRQKNREILLENNRKKHQDPEFKLRRAAKLQERRKKDVAFRIGSTCRNFVIKALVRFNAGKKATNTRELLGCTIGEFKQHIKNGFRAGMSWDNYGTAWEIDHIIPCKAFDLRKESHQRFCFNYLNQRPLWVRHNQQKGGRVTSEQKRIVEAL